MDLSVGESEAQIRQAKLKLAQFRSFSNEISQDVQELAMRAEEIKIKIAKRSQESSKEFLVPDLEKYTALIGETDSNKISTQLQQDLKHWENKIEDSQRKKSTVADKV